MNQHIDYARASSILQQLTGENPRHVESSVLPVRGGLESRTQRVVLRYRDGSDKMRTLRLIAKTLDGRSIREAYVYERVLAQLGVSVAPALFAVDEHGPQQCALWLEDVPRRNAWPWRETVATKSVMQALAQLHESSQARPVSALPPWDYEEELRQSAISTLETLEMLRNSADFSPAARRAVGPLRRLVLSLPSLRHELLHSSEFGRCFIHGDVHAGNVMLRRSRRRCEPVLIDWARARTGSPLEDVSSWLQALAPWEPDARKQHDTLLKEYLVSRGGESRIWQDLRAMYWLAGACNALAGALRYHCMVFAHSRSAAERRQAAYLAHSWLRILIRADASIH